MQTYEGPQGTRFHYHRDCRGDMIINTPAGWQAEHYEICIPARDVLAFVAHWVGRQKLRILEQATDATLLGLPDDAIPEP